MLKVYTSIYYILKAFPTMLVTITIADNLYDVSTHLNLYLVSSFF